MWAFLFTEGPFLLIEDNQSPSWDRTSYNKKIDAGRLEDTLVPKEVGGAR